MSCIRTWEASEHPSRSFHMKANGDLNPDEIGLFREPSERFPQKSLTISSISHTKPLRDFRCQHRALLWYFYCHFQAWTAQSPFTFIVNSPFVFHLLKQKNTPYVAATTARFPFYNANTISLPQCAYYFKPNHSTGVNYNATKRRKCPIIKAPDQAGGTSACEPVQSWLFLIWLILGTIQTIVRSDV